MKFLRRLTEPSFKAGYAQSPSESAHPNLWDGLAGAWMPSLGVTGNTLKDVSGNRNDGTLTNMDTATDWVATSKGLALDFDGSDRIVVPHTQKVDVRKQLTISVLCNPTINRSTWVALAYKNVPVGDGSYHIGIDPSNNLQGGVKDANWKTVQTSASVNAGSWHHVSMSIDENLQQITFYHNGEIVYQSAWTWVMSGNSYPLTISQNGTGEGFIGRTASVSIYNRALRPDEIQTLYVDSLAPFRKKQQIAFNAHPLTLLEKIRSASKPTTPISIKVKHNEEPSYKAGYAKNAGESENPHLWKGLVGAWMPSLGVTGDTLRDVSGNGNDGTLTNMDAASDWVGTKYGSGLRFTGTNMAGDFRPTQNYVSIGYDFGIMQDISASFWIKPNSLAKRGICANDVPTNPKFAITLLGDGRLEVYRGSNTQSTQSLEVDKWQHVLVESVDGVTSYYFGARFDRSQSQGAGASAGNAFVIGANYWGGVEADIANFTIYNRALFPDEIQTLYVDSLAPFRRKKSPIGYQPIKEVKGLIRT